MACERNTYLTPNDCEPIPSPVYPISVWPQATRSTIKIRADEHQLYEYICIWYEGIRERQKQKVAEHGGQKSVSTSTTYTHLFTIIINGKI